jgi:hypothetical protein
MRENMKKVLITIITIFIFITSQAQITVTVGSALLQNPGTDVHLPVSVKGLNGQTGGIGITGLELHLSYTNTSLVYDTTLNFTAAMPPTQWFFGGNGVEYSTNWLEPAGTKLNIPDNTVLFNIVFHYLGGATELVFDSARCLLVDSAFNLIPGVHYVNGIVTPSLGSGESRWNGTGPWNTSANWSNGIPGDSTNAIIETGEATVLSNAVCKAITINQGSVLNVSPGFALTVNRNYTNNGTLSLKSISGGTGSLIVKGTAGGTGTNSFSRFLDLGSATPALVSSPVISATASVFGSNVTEKYGESTASWTTIPGSENLESGTGYRISGSVPSTATFQGPFNTGNITRSNLSFTGSLQAESHGLNLLGNPYPSAIQWEQGSWSRTNLDYAVYVWNDYKYISWNGSVGALKDGIIPAMQGFFVKSNAPGASLTIPSGSRLHSSQPYYKEVDATANVISMKFLNTADTSHFDEAFVQILPGSSTGFDGSHDAFKLNGSSAYPQIYTKASDQSMLSINTQPDFVSIPVEFMAGTAGSYKIVFGSLESFNVSQPLFFEDKTTSTVINIRNTGAFVFSTDGSTQTGRFVLHFQEVGLAEGTESVFSIWNNGSTVHITPKTGNMHADQIELYNLTGRHVFSTSNLDLPVTIQPDHLTMGLYILRITTQEGIYTRKLLVR